MPAAPDYPTAKDAAPIRRALLSVSDKTGLIDMAKALSDLGVSWSPLAAPRPPSPPPACR